MSAITMLHVPLSLSDYLKPSSKATFVLLLPQAERPGIQIRIMAEILDKRAFDQLDSLSSIANPEISQSSIAVMDLNEHKESYERNQTELVDKLTALQNDASSLL